MMLGLGAGTSSTDSLTNATGGLFSWGLDGSALSNLSWGFLAVVVGYVLWPRKTVYYDKKGHHYHDKEGTRPI